MREVDTAAPPHRLMLVVGANLRAESADRPLAYRLVREIEAWIERHLDLLSVEIRPEVCTDLWYLHHDESAAAAHGVSGRDPR